MNQENENVAKTPISVIMDMAKNEIGNHAISCMKSNQIPPDLMVYILKDVLLDITQIKTEFLCRSFCDIYKKRKKSEVKPDGN